MEGLTFSLPSDFLESYTTRKVDWGFTDAAGNSIGEITFLRTYSRLKEDGTKERWWEVCKRVVEGMYSIQKNYCKQNKLPWNDRKAQASAQEAYERLFTFKWTPPGRGLWMMGTPFVFEKGSAALQSCAFVSTDDLDRNNPGEIFAWAMEALMLGIGVGWDTDGKTKEILVHRPLDDKIDYIIADTREGWIDSLRLLINSYLRANQKRLLFDYSQIRLKGTVIHGFGGTASGSAPLIQMHEKLTEIFENDVGSILGARLIADIFNLLARCVVSANVRKGAEVGIGDYNDEEFINLKNKEYFPARNSYDSENPGWSWLSNNSIKVNVGSDYSNVIDNIAENGEPGVIWLDVTRKYGRLIDGVNNKDHRSAGFNPCLEQNLESWECCTLVEVHINRAESKEDFLRTLKFAYLYGKTVTLLPTHWDNTNAVMQRNRRIGTSITGTAGFVDNFSLYDFREWADKGYSVINKYDEIYSEWLGVRESIKKTTSKPSGTVSIVSGATPGVHWCPGGEYYLRTIRFADNDKILPLLEKAGYRIEESVVEKATKVVYFPIKSDSRRSEKDVSIFEKIHLAAEVQKYWSDNGVSVTVTFDKEKEKEFISTVLNMYEGQLKAVSFLPMGNETYPQQPYIQITQEEYEENIGNIRKVNINSLYRNGEKETGEKYCDTVSCTI